MRFTLTALDPLDGEAVLSLDEAKAQVRVDSDFTDDDLLIAALRDAAVDWVEQHVGVALAPRRFRWSAAGFAREIDLPVRPVVSVQAVGYLDANGTTVALTGADWRLADDTLLAAAGKSWPSTIGSAGGATVDFTAGYASGSVPPALISAVKMLLGDLYALRESTLVGTINSEVPFGTVALCRPFRRVSV
jgi:uncharacterized phiE125 gp8 family phage protein